MRIKIVAIIFLFFPMSAFANKSHEVDHHQDIFHSFTLEADIGESRDGALMSWDFDGWVGTNNNKLWLKSEGEKLKGQSVEKAEFWALYSRNVATFWDAQVGVRIDEQPASTSYLTFGFEGLAPYFFETQAHFFLSENGDLTARIRQENDLLITQKLITQPYFELNLSAGEVKEQEIGSGITGGEFGIQTRYEFSRKFAPYFDLKYERKFGGTSTIAKKHGENRDDFIASLGLRLMF